MKTPHRGKSSYGEKKFGGPKTWERGSDGRSSAKLFLHKATCTECNKSCEVPFKPSGGRAVFCSDCFKKGEHEAKPSFGEKPAYKPAYERFADDSAPKNWDIEQIKEQLKVMNAKLDTILKNIDT